MAGQDALPANAYCRCTRTGRQIGTDRVSENPGDYPMMQTHSHSPDPERALALGRIPFWRPRFYRKTCLSARGSRKRRHHPQATPALGIFCRRWRCQFFALQMATASDLVMAGEPAPTQFFRQMRARPAGRLPSRPSRPGWESKISAWRATATYPLGYRHDRHMDLVLLRLGRNLWLKVARIAQSKKPNRAFGFDGGRGHGRRGVGDMGKRQHVSPQSPSVINVDGQRREHRLEPAEPNQLLRPSCGRGRTIRIPCG